MIFPVRFLSSWLLNCQRCQLATGRFGATLQYSISVCHIIVLGQGPCQIAARCNKMRDVLVRAVRETEASDFNVRADPEGSAETYRPRVWRFPRGLNTGLGSPRCAAQHCGWDVVPSHLFFAVSSGPFVLRPAAQTRALRPRGRRASLSSVPHRTYWPTRLLLHTGRLCFSARGTWPRSPSGPGSELTRGQLFQGQELSKHFLERHPAV